MSVSIRVGDVAPDFTLHGVDGSGAPRHDVTLSALRGSTVVLVFYPADNTPVCTVQLQTYSADIGQFAELGAQVLAISPQSVEEHEEFIKTAGPFAFPLLSDEEKDVGTAYSTIGPIGFYRRSVFVIDADGIVRYAHRSTAGLAFRAVDELAEAIRDCPPAHSAS